MRLNGEVAIVTGSTTGIGYSIAKQLVKHGVAVVINGRNEEMVKATVLELQALGGNVVGLAKPVECFDTGDELVKFAVKEFGKATILVNNAGIIADQMSYKMSDDAFSDVIDVHVKGTFFCTRPFVQQLKKHRTPGHIINMSSTAGLEGTIGQVNYSAAKAAINGMTWTLAKELQRDHIQVNAIAPAALTNMTRPYIEKARQKAAESGTELPSYWKIGSPDDVADFVIYLLKQENSEESGMIYGVNGTNIVRWHPPYSEPYSLNEHK